LRRTRRRQLAWLDGADSGATDNRFTVVLGFVGCQLERAVFETLEIGDALLKTHRMRPLHGLLDAALDQISCDDGREPWHIVNVFFRIECVELAPQLGQRVDHLCFGAAHAGIEEGKKPRWATANDCDVVNFHCELIRAQTKGRLRTGAFVRRIQLIRLTQVRTKGFLMTLPSSQRYASWLALFRIYVGIFWLSHGIPKLLNPRFFGPNGMVGMVGNVNANTTGWYHNFLVTVVLPNYPIFSHLVAWGETLTGVSLLLGVLTPVGGIVGVFRPLNYYRMKAAYTDVANIGGLDFAAMALSFINIVLPTGLKWGIDGMVKRARITKPAAGEA
jgi:uncharacterized membrane protein YphA (DoxX/SURF4 family)